MNNLSTVLVCCDNCSKEFQKDLPTICCEICWDIITPYCNNADCDGTRVEEHYCSPQCHQMVYEG